MLYKMSFIFPNKPIEFVHSNCKPLYKALQKCLRDSNDCRSYYEIFRYCMDNTIINKNNFKNELINIDLE